MVSVRAGACDAALHPRLGDLSAHRLSSPHESHRQRRQRGYSEPTAQSWDDSPTQREHEWRMYSVCIRTIRRGAACWLGPGSRQCNGSKVFGPQGFLQRRAKREIGTSPAKKHRSKSELRCFPLSSQLLPIQWMRLSFFFSFVFFFFFHQVERGSLPSAPHSHLVTSHQGVDPYVHNYEVACVGSPALRAGATAFGGLSHKAGRTALSGPFQNLDWIATWVPS